MRKRWLKLATVPIALSLVAAACGSDDSGDSGSSDTDAPAESGAPAETDAADSGDSGGDGSTSVTITGPERDESEAGAIQEVLGAWGDENGIEVTYLGDADWEANINTQVQAGNPPDISIFPQPGKLAEFAQDGYLVPLSDEALAAAEEYWSEDWLRYGNVDGVQYGTPVKSDLKSLVWYQPAAFEEAGYTVPETFDEFTALVDEMAAADGPKPLCVGIESGQATGWTFTDWVEDMVLRQHGPDVYDQWVNHDIPFNDPQIVESMQTVVDLWSEENVFASSGTVAATAFQDNGQPLVDGDCFMHRQASFFSAFIPEGTPFADGSPEAVDVFYFPDVNGDKPVLGAGTLAAGFNENDATMQVLAYMATPEYAEARQVAQAALKGGGAALSGFLSAVQGQDPSVYQPLEQSFLEILNNSQIVRFDASDLMPADVGAGTFWTQGTSLVNGDITAQEAADSIEASWPS
jgi:alpha-glucoside transport system substrate-binding protein